MRDKTGARIIFPSPDDGEQEMITIVGKEEAVRQAQKELENLVKNLVILNAAFSRLLFRNRLPKRDSLSLSPPPPG